MEELTQARLKAILSYNPETGEFHWLVARPHRPIGSRAGTVTENGYRAISIDLKRHYEHRLAWLWMMGSYPYEEIDHKNRCGTDNRFSNLREASAYENKANRVFSGTNKHNLTGIFVAPNGRYGAQIKHRRKHVFLGYFDTPQEAHSAYLEARTRLHGSFAPQALSSAGYP